MLALLATYSQEIPLDMFPTFLPFLHIEVEESPRSNCSGTALPWVSHYLQVHYLCYSFISLLMLLLHLLTWENVWKDASLFTKGFGAGLTTQVLPGILIVRLGGVYLVSASHQNVFLYFNLEN